MPRKKIRCRQDAFRNLVNCRDLNIGFFECRNVLSHICRWRRALGLDNFFDDRAIPIRIMCKARCQCDKLVFTFSDGIGDTKMPKNTVAGALGIARTLKCYDGDVHVQCSERCITTRIGKRIEDRIDATIACALFGVVAFGGNENHPCTLDICACANIEYQRLVRFFVWGKRKHRIWNCIEYALPCVKATRR